MGGSMKHQCPNGMVDTCCENYDNCTLSYYRWRTEGWNDALDEAASRIGEIKGFGKATQDSFAVYLKGLKK